MSSWVFRLTFFWIDFSDVFTFFEFFQMSYVALKTLIADTFRQLLMWATFICSFVIQLLRRLSPCQWGVHIILSTLCWHTTGSWELPLVKIWHFQKCFQMIFVFKKPCRAHVWSSRLAISAKSFVWPVWLCWANLWMGKRLVTASCFVLPPPFSPQHVGCRETECRDG